MSQKGRVQPFARRSAPLAEPLAARPLAAYPRVRLRRNRLDGWTRRMVAENALAVCLLYTSDAADE